MATHTSTFDHAHAPTREFHATGTASKLAVLIGRIFFSAIFLMAGVMHFNPAEIGYARSMGLPAAGFLVPAAGILAALGGLSILLGYHARIGAWLIVLFLIPVTLTMHQFWAAPNAAMAQDQFAHFIKNVSMLGGALIITQLGSGPWSLDARRGN